MENYYIKYISLTGAEVETAVVNFERGLNIVYGPSNTGKSYIIECINYMFGSKTKTFSIGRDTGYDCVEMLVIHNNQEIFMKRYIGENWIYVQSFSPNIESGKYSAARSKPHINEFWLELMKIEIPFGIIKNEHYERNVLSVRTFLHTFLIEEDNIPQKESILFKKGGYSRTAILSTLLYLITGDSLEEYDEIEKKPIKEAKKSAVVEYINSNLHSLAMLKSEIPAYENSDLIQVQGKINSLLSEIDNNENRLSKAIKRSEILSSEIYKVNDQLAESTMLHNRYEVLQEQYLSDIKRLTFIVEGELHKPEYMEKSYCPFCDGQIIKENHESYIGSAAAELKRITLQLYDLEEAEESIIAEKINLEEKSFNLQSERGNVETVIDSELKPKIKKLRELLYFYRRSIEIQNEIKTINNLEDSMILDLKGFETKKETEVKYRPRHYFNDLIIEGLDSILNSILKAANFDNLSSAYFNIKNFDVVVNGKEKSKYGQGYRAFLNTIVALTFMKYLKECGTYAPGMLIVDSPILSLKEKEAEQAPDNMSDNMKESLFKYMINHQDNGQMIIVENEIPKLDYGNANLIYFSKDTEHGRYGLLHELTE